jgi:hypothetical protein
MLFGATAVAVAAAIDWAVVVVAAVVDHPPAKRTVDAVTAS